MSLFSRQIDEISQKTELKFFAFLIVLLNLVSAILWTMSQTGQSDLSQLCWPIFSSCQALPSFLTSYLLWALMGTTALTMASLLTRSYRFVYTLMTLAFSLKLGLYLLNYSFSNNVQALIFLLELFFFFLPLKSSNLKFVILLFHVWLGLSKLNLNWLSGLELQSYLPNLHIKWIEWIAAMSVLIEVVIPFVLLSKLKIIFNYAWVTLALYHLGLAIVSGQIIMAYPILFIVYIAVYRHFEIKQQREQLYQSYLRPEPSKIWLISSVIIFFTLHGFPGLNYSLPFLKDSPLRLRMAKVPSHCFSRTFIFYRQATTHIHSPMVSSTGNDFKCHPNSHKNFEPLCQRLDPDLNFSHIQKVFYAKELTQENYSKVFDISENCHGMIKKNQEDKL